ncbi:MAG: hypothetical protein AB7S39_00280 [Gemmatimonadales bacterium]
MAAAFVPGSRVTAAGAGTSAVPNADPIGRWQAPAGYAAGQLSCGRFAESVRTAIRGQSGSARVTAHAGRNGILVVTARDSGAVLALEAWYDSVSVWRAEGPDRLEPDTDGFLGGRYRGTLDRRGRYQPSRTPYVPDDVAEVADLAGALDEFFPRMAPTPLEPGREWRDSTTVIRRLNDRRQGGRRFQRYQWTRKERTGERVEAGDSLAVTLDQLIDETGELLWSPEYGPLTWSRRIAITARIPATGGVKQGLRSVIDQTVEVVRRTDLTGPCPT